MYFEIKYVEALRIRVLTKKRKIKLHRQNYIKQYNITKGNDICIQETGTFS